MRFRVGSVQVHISFLFCALLCVIILFDNGVVLPCFLSVCAHEGAHLLSMFSCGVRVKRVNFEPFGIIIEKHEQALDTAKSLRIMLAGCALNLGVFLICLWMYRLFKNESLLRVAAVNFLLFALNILPAYGLDGGAVLLLLLQQKKGAENGENTAKTVSFITGVTLFVIGMILCFKIRFNPSLCLFSFYLFLQTLWWMKRQ